MQLLQCNNLDCCVFYGLCFALLALVWWFVWSKKVSPMKQNAADICVIRRDSKILRFHPRILLSV